MRQAQQDAGRADSHSRAVVRELQHLAAVRVPARVDQLRGPGRLVPGLADERLLGTPAGEACEQVLLAVADAVMNDRIRTDEAAQESVRSAMSTMRTRANEAVALVEQVQHLITDPEQLRVVYELDHTLVVIHREAQRTAVACGDLPGTAREDTALDMALGTAQSRISRHQRVSVMNHVPRETDGRVLGVQAPAAEPVIMVLAELMENAVYCSVGSGLVRAEAHRTATGVVVTVSDSGPGLDTVEKQQFVRQMLESPRLLLRDLGSPPRKGMAAIGRLVGRLDGLTLSLAPSSARGLRADLHIDASLLVLVGERKRPASSGTPLQPIHQRHDPLEVPAAQPMYPSSEGREDPARSALPVRGAPSGFPTRTRKSPGASTPQHDPYEPLSGRSADEVGASYAALQSGTRRGREHTDHSHGSADTTSWES
ncbi:hypothetical protein [Streptomyces sp. NPDC091416]|uniref:hypothetical protein n=1 Tax=Streptomyces sp. NPDC091416 TaxID=3366003 RepID=UPI00381C0C36